jgi:hypothetical protein
MSRITQSCVAFVALPCFPASSYKAHDFLWKKKLLNIKRVFSFSLQLLSATRHILGWIQRGILINVHASSCILPVILEFLDGCEKYSNIKFHENPSSGNHIVPCGRTDKTDITNFKAVHSVHFLGPCTQFIAPSKCTILIIYTYQKRISDMYRYQCTIFREHKMPVLKPVNINNRATDWRTLSAVAYHCQLV